MQTPHPCGCGARFAVLPAPPFLVPPPLTRHTGVSLSHGTTPDEPETLSYPGLDSAPLSCLPSTCLFSRRHSSSVRHAPVRTARAQNRQTDRNTSWCRRSHRRRCRCHPGSPTGYRRFEAGRLIYRSDHSFLFLMDALAVHGGPRLELDRRPRRAYHQDERAAWGPRDESPPGAHRLGEKENSHVPHLGAPPAPSSVFRFRAPSRRGHSRRASSSPRSSPSWRAARLFHA
jgi:hypothetical protein